MPSIMQIMANKFAIHKPT